METINPDSIGTSRFYEKLKQASDLVDQLIERNWRVRQSPVGGGVASLLMKLLSVEEPPTPETPPETPPDTPTEEPPHAR